YAYGGFTGPGLATPTAVVERLQNIGGFGATAGVAPAPSLISNDLTPDPVSPATSESVPLAALSIQAATPGNDATDDTLVHAMTDVQSDKLTDNLADAFFAGSIG